MLDGQIKRQIFHGQWILNIYNLFHTINECNLAAMSGIRFIKAIIIVQKHDSKSHERKSWCEKLEW